MPEILPSVCPHDCPSTCALRVEKLDARTIGKVSGAEHPYTAGAVCAKVARYAERVHHPARLAYPQRRVGGKGEGRFERIGWDDALDLTAERLRAAMARHGAESVWPFFYAGTMGLVQRDGIERLRHVMGWSRQHSTFCSAIADAGWLAGTGAKHGVDAREIHEADLVVVWGGNPVHTQVNLMHHITLARRTRGTRLVVIDPYRTPTAAKADLHLMPRPGTDAALACAVIHVLLAENLADRDYLARFTDFSPAIEAHFAARSPQWAEAISGVPAGQIREFARLYGRTPRAYLRLGYGFTRSRNGAVSMHAASCLPAVSGAWQHPGGGALYSQGGIYGLDRTLIQGLDRLDRGVRALDQSRIGAVLCGDAEALAGGPPVSAMLIQNTNPALVAPDSLAVRRGLMREDLFLCVHEQFMTETARYADVLLPATTFLEHDDLYQAGGHTFLQVARPVIEPYAECWPNHAVLAGLAERLGADHPGFALDTPALIDATLAASGRPDAAAIHAAGGLDCALDFRAAHFLDGFGHADGRFRFAPDWAALGPRGADMPPLPDHWAVTDPTDREHPFRLVTAPARHFLNSSFTETASAQRHQQRPTAFVHPDDCAALGVADGAALRIGNRRASLSLHVQAFAGVQRGVVIVESLWPAAAFPEGHGINALTSAEPAAPNGGAVFHDTAVWLRAA